MRYGPDIVERVVEELQKVPSIRNVCKKVGIDHSTFYRWMAQHFDFHKEVEAALMVGRRNINDAAEGVIISGIQKGDHKSAVYWLGHNNERYVESKQFRQFQYLEYWNTELLKKKTTDEMSPFEGLFEHHFALSKMMSAEQVLEAVSPLVDIVCHGDPKLKDIFYSAYTEWEIKKLELEKRLSKLPKSFVEKALLDDLAPIEKDVSKFS